MGVSGEVEIAPGFTVQYRPCVSSNLPSVPTPIVASVPLCTSVPAQVPAAPPLPLAPPPIAVAAPPLPTNFPPPLLDAGIYEFGADPRHRMGQVSARAWKHCAKFRSSKDIVDAFQSIQRHVLRFYQPSVPTTALTQALHILSEEQCFSRVAHAFRAYLTAFGHTLPEGKPRILLVKNKSL
jgi:hypothetical protein